VPNPVNAGETVTFKGYGEDSDGSVAAYRWTIEYRWRFEQHHRVYHVFAVGGHPHISLQVQDNGGAWSSAGHSLV